MHTFTKSQSSYFINKTFRALWIAEGVLFIYILDLGFVSLDGELEKDARNLPLICPELKKHKSNSSLLRED